MWQRAGWLILVSISAVIAAGACTSESEKQAEGKPARSSPKSSETRVVTIQPWTDNGIADGFDTTNRSGNCFTASSVSDRSDAYRCVSETSELYDPCFFQPAASGYKTEVACVTEPNKLVVVELIEPLPTSTAGDAAPDEGAIWMVVLADGTKCQSATGAAPEPVDGLPASMYCGQGGDSGILWGNRDTTKATWTVKKSTSDKGPLKTVTVATAYR